MNPSLIFSGIVFTLLMVFLIIKIKTSTVQKEYGEELKAKTGAPSELKATEAQEKEKQKKKVKLIILGVVLLFLAIGFITNMIKGEKGEDVFNVFPFWLIFLIPIFAQKKNKKSEVAIVESRKSIKMIAITMGISFLILALMFYLMTKT